MKTIPNASIKNAQSNGDISNSNNFHIINKRSEKYQNLIKIFQTFNKKINKHRSYLAKKKFNSDLITILRIMLAQSFFEMSLKDTINYLRTDNQICRDFGINKIFDSKQIYKICQNISYDTIKDVFMKLTSKRIKRTKKSKYIFAIDFTSVKLDYNLKKRFLNTNKSRFLKDHNGWYFGFKLLVVYEVSLKKCVLAIPYTENIHGLKILDNLLTFGLKNDIFRPKDIILADNGFWKTDILREIIAKYRIGFIPVPKGKNEHKKAKDRISYSFINEFSGNEYEKKISKNLREICAKCYDNTRIIKKSRVVIEDLFKYVKCNCDFGKIRTSDYRFGLIRVVSVCTFLDEINESFNKRLNADIPLVQLTF